MQETTDGMVVFSFRGIRIVHKKKSRGEVGGNSCLFFYSFEPFCVKNTLVSFLDVEVRLEADLVK
jgi:hypothetical protein